MKYLDGNGQVVALGPEIGSGGEGTVFQVQDDPGAAAKIYHGNRPPGPGKVDKLRALIRMRHPLVEKIAAWPKDLLFGPGGHFSGVLLPRLQGCHELHGLYNPKARMADHPDKDWRFLIQVAKGIATIADVLHRAGFVIGDLNPRSFFFSPEGSVRLIDCDSLQFTDPQSGQVFLCEVGMPDYTPPELQGAASFASARTPNHDAFGLAVLIFQLLFMGRHPFLGFSPGQKDDDIGSSIRDYSYFYGADADRLQIRPPVHTPALGEVPAGIRTLFERAFGRAGSLGQRPRGAEWLESLLSLYLELVPCSLNQTHWHHKGSARCPWCQADAQGVSFFRSRLLNGGRMESVEPLWQAIQAIRFPDWPDMVLKKLPDPAPVPLPARSPVPPKPAYEPRPMPPQQPVPLPPAPALLFLHPGMRHQRRVEEEAHQRAVAAYQYSCQRWYQQHLQWEEACRLLDKKYEEWVHVRLPREDEERRTRQREAWQARRRELNTQYLQKKAKMIEDRDRRIAAFDRMQVDLAEVYGRANKTATERQDGLRELKEKIIMNQERDFLDRHFLRNATIPQVGDRLKRVLAARGVETAWDVRKGVLQNTPGFGPTRVEALLRWRRDLAARFVPDTTRGIASQDLEDLEVGLARRRQGYIEALRKGPAQLQDLARQALAAKTAHVNELRAIYAEYRQLGANLDQPADRPATR